MTKIYGTGVALVTPMKADGTLDVEGIRHLVDHVSKEADYLVALGTTGEVATLTTAEKVTVLETVKDQLSGRKPLVLGHGGNDTTKLISQFKDYDFQGVDAILSVSPYYNKPSQTGIQRHYEAIADASPVPVILYNVPGRTGSNVSATTTLKLASHPNIVGTKEASGNVEQCMAIAAAKPSDFLLISGDDLLTPSLIAIGASGAISVLANAYPKEFSTMIRLCQSNDYGSASQIWSNWLDLN
ncbi:MAG TPA: 4-hydroxy-tetrahydrodipicolinate synthase, partial [Catalimonadaceae bacterium]|nr:4-hydroxy-tetrahydrodipicolinate synthase [Catalimonadaceae bacterium]